MGIRFIEAPHTAIGRLDTLDKRLDLYIKLARQEVNLTAPTVVVTAFKTDRPDAADLMAVDLDLGAQRRADLVREYAEFLEGHGSGFLAGIVGSSPHQLKRNAPGQEVELVEEFGEGHLGHPTVFKDETVISCLDPRSHIFASNFVLAADVAGDRRLAKTAFLRDAALAEAKGGEVADSGGGIGRHGPIIAPTMQLSIVRPVPFARSGGRSSVCARFDSAPY